MNELYKNTLAEISGTQELIQHLAKKLYKLKEFDGDEAFDLPDELLNIVVYLKTQISFLEGLDRTMEV